MVDFIACAMIKVGKSILLVKRKDNNLWSFPGGHKEREENPFETAIRETDEETGIKLTKPIEDSFCNIRYENLFISFIPFRLKELKEVSLDTDELIDARLFPINDLPSDCMDTVYTAIQWGSYDEHDVAQAIAKGELASPQYFDGNYLFDMRLTGTGTAKRNLEDKQTEITYRDPKEFLSKKFLNLCNGVRVVFDHPDKDNVDTEYLRNRQVGTVILPYVFDEEVWAIVKIASPLFSEMLMKTVYSTSPSVSNRSKNQPIYFEENKRALYESSPYVVDHLAIVSNGVWDKDGEALPGISTPINSIDKNGAKIIMPNDLDNEYNDLMKKVSNKRQDSRRKDDNNAFLEESERKFKAQLEFAEERIENGDFTDKDKEYLDRAREQYEKAKKEAEGSAREDALRKDAQEPNPDAARKDGDENRSVTRDEMQEMFKGFAEHFGNKLSDVLSKKDSNEPPKEPTEPTNDKKKDACKPDADSGEEPSKVDGEGTTDIDNKTIDALMKSKEGEEISDEERSQISDCQQIYTPIYQMHNKQAPKPLSYETMEQYSVRAMSGVIQHSPRWKDYGLDNLRKDKKLIAIAVDEVANDAKKAAQVSLLEKGELRQMRTSDGARTINTYTGSPANFTNMFSTPPRVATTH